MENTGEKRDEDLAALFERIFKETARDISRGMSVDAKRRYEGENRIIYFARFFPIGAMLAVMALAAVSAFLLGYAGKHILDGWWRSFTAAWLTVACQSFIVYVMWISGRATRHQSASGRWQRIVERMIFQYETSGRNTKDILRGVRISIHFHQETLALGVAAVSALALYASLDGKFVVGARPVGSVLFDLLGIPVTWQHFAYVITFIGILGALFFGVYAPLSWRKHLKVVAEQLIPE